jgi:putative phage-type endonuclease
MDPRVSKLLRNPGYKQLSSEWFQARKNCITASSAANLLPRSELVCKKYVELYGLSDTFDYNGKSCNPYSTKTQYFLDKSRGSTFTGNIATYHGQKYEPVASAIYSNIVNKPVLEFGLLVHPEIPWLAASPDGITPDGVMQEYKCPFRRKINGVPPLYYYIQTQLQMEVCNLDVCDFIEFEFMEFATEKEWLDNDTLDVEVLHCGLLVQVEKINDNMIFDPAENEYIYPNKETIDNVELLLDWKNWQLKQLPISMKKEFLDKLKISVVYWKVIAKSIVRIDRDREWFANVKPIFEKEWQKILYYKKGDNYKKLIPEKAKDIDGSVLHLNITDSVSCILSDSEESDEAGDDI